MRPLQALVGRPQRLWMSGRIYEYTTWASQKNVNIPFSFCAVSDRELLVLPSIHPIRQSPITSATVSPAVKAIYTKDYAWQSTSGRVFQVCILYLWHCLLSFCVTLDFCSQSEKPPRTNQTEAGISNGYRSYIHTDIGCIA